MAQWAKMPAVKPDDLSSMLGTHMVEGEHELWQVCPMTSTHTADFPLYEPEFSSYNIP